MSTITALRTIDVRFPTSLSLDGSDAMNADPDYSAAYVVIETDADDGLSGHGFVFTIGRGNDVAVAAIAALEPMLLGADVETLLGDLGATSAMLVGDSQLRWLGPEKGVTHMAIAAVLNALWDLHAKRSGMPLWQLLSRMTPEEIVALVDFRYLSDALTPDDEKLARLATEAVTDGFTQIKLKVGADLQDDIRRMTLARKTVGPDIRIAIDANQRWDIDDAIAWPRALAPTDPNWLEEPTSPDDVLGHAQIREGIHPVRVATGEHAQNRVIFKQLLQAEAIDIVQIDAARVGGVNESIAILLLAAKFGKPVCPHAGGVGLCEMVQHLSMFDFVAVSGSMDDRVIEYVDHLHEMFVTPTQVTHGRYAAPTAAGFSSEMHESALHDYQFPHGPVWAEINRGGN